MNAGLASISLTSVLYFLTSAAFADNTTASTPPSLVGNYKCQWTGASLENKNLSLTISKTGDTYNSEWADDAGNPVLYGTGLMNPNINDFITSSFWSPTNNTLIGVLSLTIRADGSLQGNWISQSGKETGSETCTKSS
ncbi:hypothetical protein OQJ18_08995 [Fluoribacter dumoffii]|uniref:Uncharacterized protein n=1 Tax=Fluoribacter dumoffii TaxID=463 RepID=A0A377G832_9GAMM|nr:hypothetical protein [Fluoribacter dumoffii]KTC89511.1 hypothetical protein Ldum_0579 [Fluoribacter dumoffii NY 23]MCW8384702.1 hypothetical protein [Fluoribacter dumoffii]MCW8417766.1 hypothetical protein [Fluoribacter dumoffii]MCW8454392.1 hypothetical protein [Fluoribacter dumoffii]MCW8461534.1 hypothetical protein [Fluoribacter dumoffii]